MELLSLNNHHVRKALLLSLNEMAVLCDIYMLSHKPEFDYWCIKSKAKMADWLDLNRDTIFKILNTLELKGYILREGDKCRCTNFIHNVATAQEEVALLVRNGDMVLLSVKMQELGIVGISDQSEKPTIGSRNFRPLVVGISDPSINTSIKIENTLLPEQEFVHEKYSFDQFWNMYEKKVGRTKAKVAWKRLKPDQRVLAVEQMGNHKNGKERQFWKDPERYLRDRRWEDQPPVTQATQRSAPRINLDDKY